MEKDSERFESTTFSYRKKKKPWEILAFNYSLKLSSWTHLNDLKKPSEGGISFGYGHQIINSKNFM